MPHIIQCLDGYNNNSGGYIVFLKEINPEYALERRMLKFQYSGHSMRRSDSLEETLMLGKTEGRRRRG